MKFTSILHHTFVFNAKSFTEFVMPVILDVYTGNLKSDHSNSVLWFPILDTFMSSIYKKSPIFFTQYKNGNFRELNHVGCWIQVLGLLSCLECLIEASDSYRYCRLPSHMSIASEMLGMLDPISLASLASCEW